MSSERERAERGPVYLVRVIIGITLLAAVVFVADWNHNMFRVAFAGFRLAASPDSQAWWLRRMGIRDTYTNQRTSKPLIDFLVSPAAGAYQRRRLLVRMVTYGGPEEQEALVHVFRKHPHLADQETWRLIGYKAFDLDRVDLIETCLEELWPKLTKDYTLHATSFATHLPKPKRDYYWNKLAEQWPDRKWLPQLKPRLRYRNF